MQRIASVLAGFGLVAGPVLAATDHPDRDHDRDDKVEVHKDKHHTKIEKKHKRGRTMARTKVESRSHKKLGGGRKDVTETTEEVDRPGVGHDTKRKVTKTRERDAHGNVIREETKIDR